MKKIIMLISLLAMISTSSFSVYAAEITPEYANQKGREVACDKILVGDESVSLSEGIDPQMVNEYRYRKKNVTYSYEWSSGKRVSDNLVTGPAGGSISSTVTVTFGTIVIGNISNLGINANVSISNSKNYTLNVGANKRVYMAYRVYYKVENGTREYYDMITGKVISSNTYTVKTPQYGEYFLVYI